MRPLLALLVTLAGLTACTVDDGDRPEPSTIDAFYAIDGPLTCDSEVMEVPELPLEAEPVALLICADPESSQPWTAPGELVEGDLTRLVEALSDVERAPDEPYDCEFGGGPAYDLLLRFSRERFARIHGDTGGCGCVTTAVGEWFGAQDVLDVAIEMVEREREGSAPPDAVEPSDLACDHVLTELGPAMSLTGETADLVRFVSCWQPDARTLGEWSETTVRPGDARVLAREIARRAERGGDTNDLRCPGGPRRHYFQHLVGQTTWGDVLVVYGECRRLVVPGDLRGDEALLWHPSPAAQRILDDLRR